MWKTCYPHTLRPQEGSKKRTKPGQNAITGRKLRFVPFDAPGVRVLQAVICQRIEQTPMDPLLHRAIAAARSTEDGRDYLAMHIGEAEMPALVFEGEAFMVDTHEVHHGGLEVVHVHGVPCDVVAEIV